MIAFLEIVDRTDVRVPQRPEDQDFMTKRGYLPRVAAKFVRKDLDRPGDAEFSVVDLEVMPPGKDGNAAQAEISRHNI